ncbi:MAG: hypothetical protein K6A44_01880 [bacterium]|nr:hypothetical protein [bacterium]
MTEVGKIEVIKGYTQEQIDAIRDKVLEAGINAAIFDVDWNDKYSLPEVDAMEHFLALHQKTTELKNKYENDGFFSWGLTSTKKENYQAAKAAEDAYVQKYHEAQLQTFDAIQAKKQAETEAENAAYEAQLKAEAEAKAQAEAEAKAKAEAEAKAAEDAAKSSQYTALVVDAAQYIARKEDGSFDVATAAALSTSDLKDAIDNGENSDELKASFQNLLSFKENNEGVEINEDEANSLAAAVFQKEKDAEAAEAAQAEAEAKAQAEAEAKAKAAAEATNPAEAVKKSTANNAAVQYYTVAIGNMFGKKEIDREVQQEFIDLQGAVARTMPKKENGLYDMPAARHLTLADIDTKIKDINEKLTSADRKEKATLRKELTAYQNLKDFVEEHKSALTIEEEKPEEPGVVSKAASTTGGAISATAKFIDNNVLRVSDARQGAKNAGQRVAAQYKENGVISGVISTVGNTAALPTSAVSGVIGTGTDAIDAGTDAVDNMDNGVLRAALKPISGVGKIGSGVMDLGASAIDGAGQLLKNGLYINKLWGGASNDQAIDKLTRNAFASLSSDMIRASLKPDATDEEKAAYEEALKKERVEYGYIVDVKHRLGLSDAELSRMSDEEIRAKIVESVEKETIPVDLIKAFAATPIMEQGMKEQSRLLVTDGAEAAEKATRAGGKLWGGVKDIFTLGLLDDKKEVKTQSTREITQTERDIQIAAWRADFMPKFEENKTKIIDALIPAEFLQTAIETALKENYDVENLSAADAEKARADVKRAVYDQLGAELQKKFSEYEEHRLFQRHLNAGTFGKDSFWAGFWNEIDNVKSQENNAGDRGFLANLGSYLYGVAKFPATAVLTDAPYTIAGIAGGVPFWQYQIAFSLFLGSDEHARGIKNIIEGKYNGAQKAAGYDENGYATVKDIVVWWSKHHVKKLVKQEQHCGCKPKPEPEPEPTPEPTPDETFLDAPWDFALDAE